MKVSNHVNFLNGRMFKFKVDYRQTGGRKSEVIAFAAANQGAGSAVSGETSPEANEKVGIGCLTIRMPRLKMSIFSLAA